MGSDRHGSGGLNPEGSDAETIRRGETVYRALAKQLPNVAVVVFDRDLRVLVAEGEALMNHGISDLDAEGRLLEEVMAPESYAHLEPMYRAALEGERTESEQDSPDGTHCFRVFGKPMADEKGEIWAGLIMAQDITTLRASERELRAQTKQLADIAQRDDLTRLPNRPVFRDRLERALVLLERDGSQLALLFLDLDNFKNVNDTLGHEAGDQLLKAVARRLVSAVRKADTVARLGGDEFLIMVNGITDAGDALTAVERIFTALHEPVPVVGSDLAVTASIGVALAPQDGETAEVLLAAADRAMYRAKAGRGNQHRFFDPAMHARAAERLQMEAALHHAVRRDELFLVYQPAVSLHTGEVVSVEALVRWNHPERGVLAPDEFIPIAEETGASVEITAWVLGHACRQAAAWERAGLPPMRMAVNTSSRELTLGLTGVIEQTLRAAELGPERLEIEVTERILGEDDAIRDVMLADLKRTGVSIALDDFGTGYSSLARLRSFPVDTIKIDRMFIAELDKTSAIPKTIVALADNLGLSVIAEGVETVEQLASLEAMGCQAASGCYICRPQPAEQLTPWLWSTADQGPGPGGRCKSYPEQSS